MEIELKILLLQEYEDGDYRHVHHTDGPPRIEHVIITSDPELIKGKIREWIKSSDSLESENAKIAERLRKDGHIVADIDWGDNDVVEFIDPYWEKKQ
ncbi:MAG: hypothetical protein ACE1ZC_00315 [Nitrososphaerales archaeon]